MKDGTCYITFCWIFQVFVWIMLIITIVSFIADISAKTVFLVLFFVFYIVYIILEFCSSSAKYLCGKTTEAGIYQKIGTYYRTYPVFKFYCECYHYETRRHTVRTRHKGKTRTRTVTKRVRVTTHRETYFFPYYSERDVSGLFYLDCDRAILSKKSYIQLDIFDEINFADAISYYDYQHDKDLFWRRNRFRDRYFYFNESRYIPGLVKENLVTIGNTEPCCINFCCYFLFTIITFVEIYKIYFNSLCISQTYRIRKLVSTRYDLNQPIYQDFIPQINLINQQFSFQDADYNYLNNNYNLVVPTAQELEKAKIYQNKVPDYKISSGGGKIHAGVVLDDPSYCSYDLNKPPEAFTSIAGEVGLQNNQINPNGELPKGFGEANFKFNIAQNDDDDAPGPGYGSNAPPTVNNNQINTNFQNPQANNNSERIFLKDNQNNPQQYPQQYSQQYPQQYPAQYSQQYPQQYQQYQQPPQYYPQ